MTTHATTARNPERFDDEPRERLVPPCAVDRYLRNLGRLRQLCLDAQSTAFDDGPDLPRRFRLRGALAEVEAGLAEIQMGLEFHRGAYLDAEKAAAWQRLRDNPEKAT